MINKEKLIDNLISNSLDCEIANDEYITVAELKTIDIHGIQKTIDRNTAIVSPNLINRIKASHVDPFVKRTGVDYNKDFIYTPAFWLYLSKPYGLKKAEPLVISWASGNHTTLYIDQGLFEHISVISKIIT